MSAKDIGLVLALVAATALGFLVLIELVPFTLGPPRVR